MDLGTAHPGAVDLNRMLSCSVQGGDVGDIGAGDGGVGPDRPSSGRGRPRATDEGVVQEALTAAAEQINDQATVALVNLRNARVEGEGPDTGGGGPRENETERLEDPNGADRSSDPAGPGGGGDGPTIRAGTAGPVSGPLAADDGPSLPIPRSPSEIKSAALTAAQNAAAQQRAQEAAARHIAIYQMMAASARAAQQRQQQSRMVGMAVARMQCGRGAGGPGAGGLQRHPTAGGGAQLAAGADDPNQAARTAEEEASGMPPPPSAEAPPAATAGDSGPCPQRKTADDGRRAEEGDPGRGDPGERSET